MRRWCSHHSFFARVIQQLGFCTQQIQANVDYCHVRLSAECTSLSALDFKHPSLRSDSSLAAKRRAEALYVVFLFNKGSEPSTRAAALCVYSRMIHTSKYVATKDARWVRCSPCSLGPSPRRPTASCSLTAVRRGDCVRASWLYSKSNASIATRTRTCLYLVLLLLYQAGYAQLHFFLIKDRCHF